MKPILRLALVCLCTLVPAAAQSDVGSGSPTEAIRSQFLEAYFRNQFSQLVALPPLADVKKFGTTGLLQEFQDASKTGVKFGLVKPNVSAAPVEGQYGVYQVLAPLYTYYSSVGVTTAGYPKTDTRSCPAVTLISCVYQIFDKPYALFTYSSATPNGTNFAVRDPFYTKWNNLGGVNGLGPVVAAETTDKSATGTSSTFQTYQFGAIFNFTTGNLTGNIFAVKEPIWDLYVSANTYLGKLGMPTSDEYVLASGAMRQSFEGGVVEYTPNGSGPILKLPVSSVIVTPQIGSANLKLGDTLVLTATAYDANGQSLTDRTITWVTTNARVVSVAAPGNGAKVTLTGTGGGTAKVTATVEGKSSIAIIVTVTAPCCQVGEGAPTSAIAQAFSDAVTRNRLSVKVPAAAPVRRAGTGYLQDLLSADGMVRYVVANSDRTPSIAYVLQGALLGRWEESGGATGALGYPTSDGTAGGRQLFENGALGGNPPRLVSAAFLTKWAGLSYETGTAGSPTGDPVVVLSFAATSGLVQAFTGGVMSMATSGSQNGKVYFVGGLALAKYNALGGPAGKLGLPVNDEYGISGKRQQDFEGGTLQYSPGDAEAQVVDKTRKPSISVTPAVAAAGGRVRIAVGGFDSGATLKISASGDPDFTVAAASGAFVWEAAIPLSAKTATIVLRATDTASGATASTTYTIKSSTDANLRILKVRGDLQNVAPGTIAAQPLQVRVQDDGGNPLAGIAVAFTGSPGVVVSPANAVTDVSGLAATSARVPPAEGIALVNANAVRQVATFSLRAASASLSNFVQVGQASTARIGPGPALISEKGAMLAAVASIVRYYQSRGEVPATAGLADADSLNQYLNSFCATSADGAQVCDGYLSTASGDLYVNPWRVPGFVAGRLDVAGVNPTQQAIRDMVAQGIPVLVALDMKRNGSAAGAHFVVATGVRSDGSISVSDSYVQFSRAALEDYLNGFSVAGAAWQGSISGALVFLPQALSASTIVVTADAPVTLASPAGLCPAFATWPAQIANVSTAGGSSGSLSVAACDGTQPFYRLDVTADPGFRGAFVDQSDGGSRLELSGAGASSFKIVKSGARWTIAALETAFEASAVVNSASYLPVIAPGTIISIFGSGLGNAAHPSDTQVEANGRPATVLAVSAFQVNAALPADLDAGAVALQVKSAYGAAQQTIPLRPTAPAIFQLAPGQWAVVNPDGTINSAIAPARRGQVVLAYGTGFGLTIPQGTLQAVSNPVIARWNGVSWPVAFAGLAPGFVGLYQLNLQIPASTAPALDGVLVLEQGGVSSPGVKLAVQ